MGTRVLVTGADGFIGSHLTQRLLARWYEVRAFCQYNSFGSWGWIETLEREEIQNIDIVMGDVRDAQSVKSAMKGCEIVYHLAALIAIPYSYIAQSSYIDTNITGTLNVLQAGIENDVKRIVHTSTSETYGSAQYVPIDESHPLVGQSPYAATKIGADQLAISYWRSFELPVTILRPFNTYGPRQSARAVIPTLITQTLKNETNIKIGALTPTRDFNFVEDTCDAFIAVSEGENTCGKVINSASSFEVSIGETAELIMEIIGKELEISTDESRIRPTGSEVNRLYGCNKLLRELTDWSPNHGGKEGFKKGLEKTIEWFSQKQNLARYKEGIYNI